MATKSKHRKNHKQKVAARRQRVAEQKRKTEKFQREFIMNLIKQEQEKGLFENNPSLSNPSEPILDGPILGGPVIDGPLVEGTVIDGPLVEGPVIEGPIVNTEVVETEQNMETSTTEDSEQ